MNDDPIQALYPDDVPATPEATEPAAPVQVKAEEAPAPEEKPAAGVPERYQLAIEGMQLDSKLVAEAEPIFRELGLSNQQANALLPIAPKIVASAEERIMQHMIDEGSKQRKAWLESFVNDREIGGARQKESERLAQRGMEALGFGKDHPFRRALTETGFGNHPDMIRILRWVGANSGGDRAGGKVPTWKALYPDG